MGLFGKNRSTPVRNLRRPFPAPVTISATAPLAMELNGALATARLRKVKRAILPDRPPASEQRPQVSRRAAAELCTDVDPGHQQGATERLQ